MIINKVNIKNKVALLFESTFHFLKIAFIKHLSSMATGVYRGRWEMVGLVEILQGLVLLVQRQAPYFIFYKGFYILKIQEVVSNLALERENRRPFLFTQSDRWKLPYVSFQ